MPTLPRACWSRAVPAGPAALAIAVCCGVPAGAQQGAPATRTVLANGLTVLAQEDHGSPLVTVAVMYRVGARNEAAGSTGLAHYVEHMNFRATRAFPGHETTEAITRMGGRWSGYTWIDQTYYAETVPSQALERMLDLEADRMTGALYDPHDFQQERSSVIAELNSYDDPESLLYDAVLAASFEIHPYRNNTIGWLTDVERLTRDDAYRFYRRFYHPASAVLVIVGNFESAAALRLVEARFAGLARGEPSDVSTVEPPQSGQRRVEVRRPGAQARVLLAFRAPALTERDFAAMVLFDALLAGGKGAYFTHDYAPPAETLLGRAARLAVPGSQTETRWQASLYPYVYTLAASAPPGQALATLEAALFQALEETATRRWSDEEWQSALRQIRTGWAIDMDAQDGRAHQLAFFEVAGGYERLYALPEAIASLTRDDVARFARERLQPHQATVGWFVPSRPAAAAPTTAVAPPTVTASAPPPAVASAAAPPSVRAPAPLEWTLANGLRVILAPRAGSALLAMHARIEAGSRYDAEGRAGASALATEWLASARPDEPRGAPGLRWTLHEEPASTTSLSFIELSAVGLPEDMPALLETLAGRLTRPAPTGQPWSLALERLRQRAREWDLEADTALWRRSLALLFPPGTAASAPPWSDDQALAALDSTSLADFLAARVSPSRTLIVLAGGLDAEEARRELERTLGRWIAPKPRAAAARPWPQPRGAAAWTTVALSRPGSAQDDICVVWPGDRSRPRDDAATRALLYLFGETGYAGRLGRALVEPGLVYSVYATLEEERAPGFLMIRTAAATKDTPEVLRRIREVLDQAASGTFTQAELEEARTYLHGKAAREREGTVPLAATLAEGALHAAPEEPAALTLADLNATARRLFARGAPFALVAGPGQP